MTALPVEAVIFDFGGVISVSLFRDLARFESDLGYPPGSLLELLFGETSAIGNPRGGDPVDGVAGPGTNPVTHDWHRLEVGELTLQDYLLDVIERAPAILGEPIGMHAYARFVAELPIGVHWPVVHAIRTLQSRGYTLALLTNNVREFGDDPWAVLAELETILDRRPRR